MILDPVYIAAIIMAFPFGVWISDLLAAFLCPRPQIFIGVDYGRDWSYWVRWRKDDDGRLHIIDSGCDA